MSNVLTAEQICKSYRDGQQVTDVLHGVDISINRGDMLAIVGSSGSGKSTLLHILGTLDKPDSGRLTLLGKDVASLSSAQKAALPTFSNFPLYCALIPAPILMLTSLSVILSFR